MRFPELQEMFEGRYQVAEVLGEGAFARVYKAWDTGTQRFVALKVLSPKGGGYSDLTGARFNREARIIAGLQSPHTITMYEFGQTDSGLMYMVCEYLQGRDLHRELMESRHLPAEVVVHVVDQLLQSLLEAHRVGVFHRDIKPANILLTEYQGDRYRATLVDFGLARPISDDSTQLTKPGKTAGTPRYMAPEQVYAEDMGPATDLYSLGLVAYEMWTGVPAIDGADQRELLLNQVKGPPTLVPEQYQPASLRRVIEKMTERDLSRRYPSAEAVLHDLRQVRRELRQRPLPPAPLPPSKPGGRRWELVILAVAVVFVLFLAFAALVPVEESAAPAAPQSDHVALPSGLTEVTEHSEKPKPEPPVEVESEPQPEEEPSPNCRPLEAGYHRFGSGAGPIDIYVPEGLTRENARAVVVLARRGGESLQNYEFLSYSGFDKVADEHKVLVLLPDHKGGPGLLLKRKSWSDASVEEAWKRVLSTLDETCTNDLPIGLFGEFKGGQGVDLMQCLSDRVQAVAVSSHRYEFDDEKSNVWNKPRPCKPDKPVPYLEIGHTENGGRPFDGGKSCADRSENWWSFELQRKRFRARQRCDDTPGKERKFTDGTCTTWACQAPYISCVVDGGPSFEAVGQSYDGVECSGRVTDFPHTEAIWEFFDQHLPRPERE